MILASVTLVNNTFMRGLADVAVISLPSDYTNVSEATSSALSPRNPNLVGSPQPRNLNSKRKFEKLMYI